MAWDRPYLEIVAVVSANNILEITFANGDRVQVNRDAVTPPDVIEIAWESARVDGGGHWITVEARSGPFGIPWDVIRTLTDPAFAKEAALSAARQARYVGAVLRKLRHDRQLTQAQVAERAGIQPANLSRIENGQFDVSTSTLWKILAAMAYCPRDMARYTYAQLSREEPANKGSSS